MLILGKKNNNCPRCLLQYSISIKIAGKKQSAISKKEAGGSYAIFYSIKPIVILISAKENV